MECFSVRGWFLFTKICFCQLRLACLQSMIAKKRQHWANSPQSGHSMPHLKVDNKLNASLKSITEDNLKELKKLNLLLFPNIYFSPNFYKDVTVSGFYSRLAYIGETPVGVVCCSLEGPRDDGKQQQQQQPQQQPKQHFDLLVMTIGVLALYRSEGVGSLMMRHVLSVAKHDDRIESIYLHVKVRGLGRWGDDRVSWL